jgi:hypothetical protein
MFSASAVTTFMQVTSMTVKKTFPRRCTGQLLQK